MKRLSAFFILFILSTVLFIPSPALASCNCWCETSGGAEEKGSVADIATCQSTCDDFLGCYTDEQQSMNPDYNTLCWSQFECESQPIELGGETLASEWDGQASFCPADKGYCFSEPQAINLNIAIGSLTEATSLGQYINAVYSWLLVSASFLAIVVMMIGGIEYILARGNPSKITTATTHLKQATTGIVLLFASYAIANTIDPHFTTFNRLQPPRIRTVVFLDESSTCEAMISAGLSVTPNPPGYQTCGYTGVVTGIGSQQTSVDVGTECIYSACVDEQEICMSTALASEDANNGYQCIRCGTAHLYGVPVSESTCEGLKPSPAGASDSEHYYCVYHGGFADVDLIAASCREIAYPITFWEDEGTSLDCAILEDEHGASCRAYDFVQGSYISTFDVGDPDVEWDEIDDMELNFSEYPLLEAVCLDDPCGFAPPGESCIIYANDPSEEHMIAIGLTGIVMAPMTFGASVPAAVMAMAVVWVGGDELVANCANESADAFGLWDCKDKNGDSIGCELLEIDLPGL